MCRHQGAGGWHHPVHIHLSDYIIIRANRGDDEYNDWDILTQVRFFNDGSRSHVNRMIKHW